jgi:hypothetical protein
VNQVHSDPEALQAQPAMLVPMDKRLMDDLVDQAYTRSDLTTVILACLRDPDCRQWTPVIQRKIRVVIADYRVLNGHIYIRGKLFLLPDDKLRTQAVYRTHSSGPEGHLGRMKTLNLLNHTYWWPRMSRDVTTYVRACELCI